MRALPILMVLATTAACGDSGDRTSNASAAGAATPEIDLEIERVDDLRYVVPVDALVRLSVEAAAGRIEAELADRGLALGTMPVGGALAQLGLAAGDVITRVDGQPVDQPAALRDRYRASLVSGHVDVEWQRGDDALRRRYYWRESLPERPATEPATAETRALTEAVATGVRERGDVTEIDREVLRAFAELGDVLSSRRPHGARFGVVAAADGPLAAIGLTGYDLIKSVDADDILGAGQLARALALRADAASFALSVVRLEEPIVVHYRVVSDLVMDAQLAQALAAWNASTAAQAARPSDPAASFDGIRQVSDEEFIVERAAIETAMKSPHRLARVVPHHRGGAIDGFKLYAIRTASALRAAGLRNGDLVIAIDGRPMRDLDELAGLADQLVAGE